MKENLLRTVIGLTALQASSTALALSVSFTEIPNIDPSLGVLKPLAVANDGTVAMMTTDYELITWDSFAGKTLVSQLSEDAGDRIWPTISYDGDTVLFSNFYQTGHETEKYEDYYYRNGELTVYTFGDNTVINLYAMSGDGDVLGGQDNGWPGTITDGVFKQYRGGPDSQRVGAFNRTGDKFATNATFNGIGNNVSTVAVWKADGDYVESSVAMSIKDMTADGNTVLGYLPNSQGSVLWNSLNNQYTYISDIRHPRAFSADGDIVVGNTWPHNTMQIWDSVNGTRSIPGLIASYGIDISDWSGLSVQDISEDGSKIVGYGTNPAGEVRAFIIDITQECNPYL